MIIVLYRTVKKRLYYLRVAAVARTKRKFSSELNAVTGSAEKYASKNVKKYFLE